MPGASTDAVTDVMAALRRYLHAYPLACDTVEGIAAWWLPRTAGSSSEVVATALDALVANGEMECASGADGRAVYRAAPSVSRQGMQVEPSGS